MSVIKTPQTTNFVKYQKRCFFFNEAFLINIRIYRVSQKKIGFRKIALPLIMWPYRGL